MVNTYNGKAAKYVFLFIGDGMALPQVTSAEIYANAVKGGKYPGNPRVLSFTSFGSRGLTTTHDASSFITDSASAGTALATGHKTLNGVISMDVDEKEQYPSVGISCESQRKESWNRHQRVNRSRDAGCFLRACEIPQDDV